MIILIFAKYVSFCIKIHRLNNLLNDTNDHFKCRREHIKQLLFFVPLCSIFIHSYIKFFFPFLSIQFFHSQSVSNHFKQILQIGSMTSNQYQVAIDPEITELGERERDQTLFFLQ